MGKTWFIKNDFEKPAGGKYMNSRERFIKAAKGGKPEVIPVAPYMGNHGAQVAGIPISEYNTDGKKMAEAQMKAWDIYKQDVVVAQSDNYYIAEGFGCVIDQPYNQSPNLVKPALDDIKDESRLKIPDPETAGRMPVYLEAVNILKEELENQVAVRGPGTGPFSLAGHILGTDNFLMEIAMAEAQNDLETLKHVHNLMGKTSETLIRFLTELIKAGSDVAMLLFKSKKYCVIKTFCSLGIN